MKLTGYFIKELRQYGEMFEKIARTETLANDLDNDNIRKMREEQEEYLNELVKMYS